MSSVLSFISFCKPIIPKASSWLLYFEFTPSIRTLSNNTNWAGINITLNGTELDLGSGQYAVEGFVRTLDMKTAVYTRSFTVCDTAGRKTELAFKRFLSMDEKSIGCVSVKATPLNYSGEIVLTPYLDGNVKNEDANYDDIFWNRISKRSEPYPAVTMETKKTNFSQSCAMQCICTANGKQVPPQTRSIKEKYAEQECTVQANQAQPVELIKIVCVSTSRDIDVEQLESTCFSKLRETIALGAKELLHRHCQAMGNMWRRCDIQIEGDPAAQQGIRYSILELMLTYSGTDIRLNIGPKGFTGEKYGGSTYWDTEAFCFPFYLNYDPVIARNLLMYRYNHLPMAKENARKLGLNGALYPMVTIDGHECHNEWEITFEEIHRNGAIAYAIYHYTNFTGDKEYLANYGIEVLVELSRFWANRVTYNNKKDSYMILGVTGPNEYENNVNNNFYTNTMAAWTLEYTLECLKEIVAQNMPDDQEMILWREIAAKIYLPYVNDLGVFEQNDLYIDKELLTVDMIPTNERPIYQHWSWDSILRSCYIKQADVVQALYFFPHKYSINKQRRNFDFYEPMTVHESSLSSSIYSIVASRIGYTEKAYALYLCTSRLDLEDVNNDTEDGLHITSMGATWVAVIQGFVGIDTEDGILIISPRLPQHWESLSFTMNFRGAKISIKIVTREIHIRVQDKDLVFAVYGDKYSLVNGESMTIQLEN